MKQLKLFLFFLVGATVISCSSDDDKGSEQSPIIGTWKPVSSTMKKILKILIFTGLILLNLTLFSCENEEESSFSKEKLEKYLLSRGENFVFVEQTELEKLKKGGNQPIYLNSIEELEDFLNEIDSLVENINLGGGLQELTPYFEDPEDVYGGGSGVKYIKETKDLGYTKTMNIGYYLKNCVGSNISSWISGFTLEVYYKQTSANIWSTNNGYSYNVEGTLNYTIFFEGIGTYYTENISFMAVKSCPIN